MNKTWLAVPLFLLVCYVGWIGFFGIQAKRESDAFREAKTIDLGVLNASDAQNRMHALRALVDILGTGVYYQVKWRMNTSGKRVDYEFSVGPATGPNGLLYCEESDKSTDCFAFYNLKPDTLSKIASDKQSIIDPLKQLEKQGYKKQRL